MNTQGSKYKIKILLHTNNESPNKKWATCQNIYIFCGLVDMNTNVYIQIMQSTDCINLNMKITYSDLTSYFIRDLKQTIEVQSSVFLFLQSTTARSKCDLQFLLEHVKRAWHLELQAMRALKQEHRFVLHRFDPEQLHFMYPCPPQFDSCLTAARSEIEHSSFISCRLCMEYVQTSNWFREYLPWSTPLLTTIVYRPLSSLSLIMPIKFLGSDLPRSTAGIGTVTESPTSASGNIRLLLFTILSAWFSCAW